MLLLAQEAPWPVQAVAMAVVGVVLIPLLAYLRRSRQTRGSSGGRDAFAVVWGAVMLVLVGITVAQGRGVPFAAVAVAVLAIAAGWTMHRQARRRRA